jgi:hypothetical protein
MAPDSQDNQVVVGNTVHEDRLRQHVEDNHKAGEDKLAVVVAKQEEVQV